MRQFNFVILFATLLGVALFAMQNASPVTVQFVPGVELKTPLVLELLLAAGSGAAIAWIYSIWTGTQSKLEARKKDRELAEKEGYISQLKEMVVDLESAAKQLPAPSKRAEALEDSEVAEEIAS